LCRFHEPDAGGILIDGVDYREMGLQDLRRQIGLVLQEPFLVQRHHCRKHRVWAQRRQVR
jgi:ABC-type multidrug transport system fused ATPase/permease subunit